MIVVQTARLSCAVALLAVAGCTIPVAGPSPLSRIAVVAPPGGADRVVTVPGCPDFSRRSREDFSNRDASNFGCADAVDFVAQLADPLDAVRGRGTGAREGGAAAAAVERYRIGKTMPLAGEGTGNTPPPAPAGGPS